MGAEEAAVELLDAPPLPEAARLTRDDITGAIGEGSPECVVLVLRCDAPSKERNAAVRRLPEISAAVRAKGQSASAKIFSCGLFLALFVYWAVQPPCSPTYKIAVFSP
jgi:hypothetical protein